MAQVFTMAEMVLQVRVRTDNEASTHLDDDTMLVPWINAGIAKVYRKLFDRDPAWYIVAGSVTTTSGTQEYALPEDFLAMNGVTFTEGGIAVEVPETPFRERLQRQTIGPFGRGIGYRIQRSGVDGSGARIRFEPQPGVRTFAYEYTPAPPRLVDGDSWDGIAGFDEYPIEFACAKVRVKCDEDPSPHLRAMADIEGEIKKMGNRRNVGGGGPRIARTRRTHRMAWRGPGVP